MKRSGVRRSVYPSHLAACGGFAANLDIDRLLHGARICSRRGRLLIDPYPQQHGGQQQCHVYIDERS